MVLVVGQRQPRACFVSCTQPRSTFRPMDPAHSWYVLLAFSTCSLITSSTFHACAPRSCRQHLLPLHTRSVAPLFLCTPASVAWTSIAQWATADFPTGAVHLPVPTATAQYQTARVVADSQAAASLRCNQVVGPAGPQNASLAGREKRAPVAASQRHRLLMTE